ncbi:MAG: nitric oxide synthase [Desulfatitalea sp.]|nr:flavodoxin domain-containing protein [Desulfatitalea sp.]NNK00323.1 nitric oxide synthase [Desulfatitalea sp.]
MAKALIVYATRTGETEQIANLIAEGIRIGGQEAVVVNANEIKNESQLEGYEAHVFGSATYHGGMIESMKRILFLAEKADLTGRVGAAFGAFGWSGEAPQRIYDTMRHIFHMDMVKDALRLKSAALEGGVPMAHDYGREIATKMA